MQQGRDCRMHDPLFLVHLVPARMGGDVVRHPRLAFGSIPPPTWGFGLFLDRNDRVAVARDVFQALVEDPREWRAGTDRTGPAAI